MIRKSVRHAVRKSRTLLIVCGATVALSGCLLNSVPVPVVYGDGATQDSFATPKLRNGERVITVQSGDSVSAIAERYHADFRKLAARNDLSSPYVIYPGQRLVLPPWTPNYDSMPPTATAQRRVPVRKSVKIAGRDTAVTSTALPAPDTRASSSSTPVRQSRLSGGEGKEPASGRTRVVSSGATIPVPGIKPQDFAAKAARQFASTKNWHNDARNVASAETSSHKATAASKRDVSLIKPPSRSGFIWPVEGRVVLDYGAGPGGLFNDGINIAADRGTPILAADNGVVTYVGNELRGFGNLILIKHADGYISAYAHTENPMVARGDIVKRGQRISSVGSTGSVTRPQLHFEIRVGRKSHDPLKYLPQAVAAR